MPRDNRCMHMTHVYFYVCCSDCVGVCGNVCCVAAVVKNRFFCSLGVLKYVVCLCMGCDGCCVFCLYCEVWSCRCSCKGSVSVSSCRCCMFLSCVNPVTVINAAFCMICSLLTLVENARGDHMEEVYSHSSGKLESTHPSRTSVKSDQGFFGVESVMRVNADSLLIRAAATSTSGTLNDLTTDLIMANNRYTPEPVS